MKLIIWKNLVYFELISDGQIKLKQLITMSNNIEISCNYNHLPTSCGGPPKSSVREKSVFALTFTLIKKLRSYPEAFEFSRKKSIASFFFTVKTLTIPGNLPVEFLRRGCLSCLLINFK